MSEVSVLQKKKQQNLLQIQKPETWTLKSSYRHDNMEKKLHLLPTQKKMILDKKRYTINVLDVMEKF